MTILVMLFGGVVGAGVMALFNSHSFDKGAKEGEDVGYLIGYDKGFSDGHNMAKTIEFHRKEVSK